MRTAVILDAGALDGASYSASTRALIERALARDAEVWCCAVNLAEVCRGRSHTASVESFLRRGVRTNNKHGAITVRATDEAFAKRVGAILHAVSLGSSSLTDAHVVALCADFDAAIVLTTDSADIISLTDAIPAVRVIVRRPN